MESIIQKINFLKNENCIFSFLNFWNINLNVIFRFFEIRILISIWVSIKIELNLNLWCLWRHGGIVWLVDVCFVLCMNLFNDFYFECWLFEKQKGLLGKRKWLKFFKGVKWLKAHRWLEGNKCSRKQKLSYIDDIQRRNKHQRNYKLNNGWFHENLAIHISNSFKNYF